MHPISLCISSSDYKAIPQWHEFLGVEWHLSPNAIWGSSPSDLMYNWCIFSLVVLFKSFLECRRWLGESKKYPKDRRQSIENQHHYHSKWPIEAMSFDKQRSMSGYLFVPERESLGVWILWMIETSLKIVSGHMGGNQILSKWFFVGLVSCTNKFMSKREYANIFHY